MKRALLCTIALLTLAGCSPADRTPEALKKDAAKVTSEATRDAKAAVKGVEEAMKTKGSVNINQATAEELESLPGIDAAHARRIIASRPFKDPEDLVKRHLVTRVQYERIAKQVVAE